MSKLGLKEVYIERANLQEGWISKYEGGWFYWLGGRVDNFSTERLPRVEFMGGMGGGFGSGLPT